MQNSTGLQCLTWETKKKHKYLHQINSFREFLKNIKADTPQATLFKKCLFMAYTSLMCMWERILNWENNGFILEREHGFTWSEVIKELALMRGASHLTLMGSYKCQEYQNLKTNKGTAVKGSPRKEILFGQREYLLQQ